MSTTSNHNQNPVSQPPCQGDANQLQQSQQKQPITTNLASDDDNNGSSTSYCGPIRKMVSLQIRTNVTRRSTMTTTVVDCPPTPGTPEHMIIPSLGLNSSSWNVYFFFVSYILIVQIVSPKISFARRRENTLLCQCYPQWAMEELSCESYKTQD